MAGNSQQVYEMSFAPYRNTAEREQIRSIVYANVASVYNGNTNLAKPVFVRPGYFNDLAKAGATNLTGFTVNLIALSSPVEGFDYGTVFQIQGPQTAVLQFYGVKTAFPNPAIAGMKYSQNGKEYPITVWEQETPEDNKILFRGLLPVIQPNNKVTITLVGTAAGSAAFQFLFAVGEQNPGQTS
jgi:hypothetical protein